MTKRELWEKAKMLPLLPGVYIIRDKTGEIIYIGKAKRLRTRVSQYFREGVPHDAKVTKMIQNAFEFDVIVTQSEFEALVLECSQIKQHKPKYNILLKDDKGYSYVKVTREAYPRISAALQKDDDNADYIGPYTSSFAVREMVETACNVFRLPRCSKKFPQDIGKGRPCLNAHIGRCMAVCSGKISREDYNEAVQSAVHMIRRGQGEILKLLRERMADAAERLDFERAALIRDQIAAIEKVSRGQKVVRSEVDEQDVVAFAGTASAVCAAILRFREGRLVDKREFLFHDTQDIPALREEFLPRYYLEDNEFIPKSIAVDELPAGSGELARLLGETRGSKVRLYVPQRGDTARLVEMARTNAVERLARESGRYAREQKHLDELAALLGLKEPPRIIESYDISNWGDGTSVAGMVVFEDGKPKKSGLPPLQDEHRGGYGRLCFHGRNAGAPRRRIRKGRKRAVRHKAGPAAHRRRARAGKRRAGRAGGHTACRCSHVRHGEGRQAPHARPCERRRRRDHAGHAQGRIHVCDVHSGRDAPLGQRLPQAHAEKPRLFFHAAKRAGRRPGHQPRADGPFQNGVCR